MKKIISLVLVSLITLSLCGCSFNKDELSSFLNNISIADNQSVIIDLPSEKTVSSQITSSKANNTDNVASKRPETTSSSKPSAEKPITPDKPEVSQPTVNKNNDATQANNNRVNEFIQSQLPSGGSVTQGDIDRIINNLVKKDGVTFYNPDTINDKVTMVNLYYEPMEGKFKELDAKVMSSLKSGVAIQIETGYTGDEAGKALMQEYANELYWKNTVAITSYNILRRGTESEIVFNTSDLIKQKEKLENKVYYKAVQHAIKECGIYEGMLQRDAIIKFNDYICQTVEYDYENYTSKLEDFFCKGEAICNSYTQVFEILCRTVGIDAQFMGGNVNVDGKNEPHAWNRIEFSGNRIAYFDTCWNDGKIIINKNVYQKTDRYMFVKSFSDRTVTNPDTCMVVGYSDKFVRN